jgi:DNA-binding MarR family transcriptional regulator
LTGVSRHGADGITQTELANVLDLGKVALGGLIDRLEDRGFVERRADAEDRRINRVFLTKKGEVLLDRMTHIGMDMNAKVMKGISLSRQHLLAETLHDMKVNLIGLDAVPGSKAKRENRANGRAAAEEGF